MKFVESLTRAMRICKGVLMRSLENRCGEDGKENCGISIKCMKNILLILRK